MTHLDHQTTADPYGVDGTQPTKNEMSKIILPLAPIYEQSLEAKICASFIRHLRHVPSQRSTVKILSSIHYTADMVGCSDAHVSKVLVDYGLRAPRQAFPEQFLAYLDESFMRYNSEEFVGQRWSYRALQEHWSQIGEDIFAPVKKDYAYHEYSFVTG